MLKLCAGVLGVKKLSSSKHEKGFVDHCYFLVSEQNQRVWVLGFLVHGGHAWELFQFMRRAWVVSKLVGGGCSGQVWLFWTGSAVVECLGRNREVFSLEVRVCASSY